MGSSGVQSCQTSISDLLCTEGWLSIETFSFFSLTVQNLQKIYEVLKWAFTIFPQFCLGQGLIELCYNQIRFDLTHSFGVDSYVNPFEMNFLGWIFVALTLQGTVLLLLRTVLHRDLLEQSGSVPKTRWQSDSVPKTRLGQSGSVPGSHIRAVGG